MEKKGTEPGNRLAHAWKCSTTHGLSTDRMTLNGAGKIKWDPHLSEISAFQLFEGNPTSGFTLISLDSSIRLEVTLVQ